MDVGRNRSKIKVGELETTTSQLSLGLAKACW